MRSAAAQMTPACEVQRHFKVTTAASLWCALSTAATTSRPRPFTPLPVARRAGGWARADKGGSAALRVSAGWLLVVVEACGLRACRAPGPQVMSAPPPAPPCGRELGPVIIAGGKPCSRSHKRPLARAHCYVPSRGKGHDAVTAGTSTRPCHSPARRPAAGRRAGRILPRWSLEGRVRPGGSEAPSRPGEETGYRRGRPGPCTPTTAHAAPPAAKAAQGRIGVSAGPREGRAGAALARRVRAHPPD